MARAPERMNAPQLVPLDPLFCGTADFGSEDTNEGCFCGDAGTFVIKKNDVHPALSHSEWFCSSLANAVGVPQVPFNIIRHPNGACCFGSQWMNGKTKDWWNLAIQGSVDFGGLAEDLSRIYVYDLFIHNIDRQLNNFMVVPHGEKHKVYSFDYSRSWLVVGFPMPPVMDIVNSSTIKVKNWIKLNFGDFISIQVATEVLDAIATLNVARVRQIIASHPVDWLTEQQEGEIIDWWENGMASDRVAAIKVGLKNGALT